MSAVAAQPWLKGMGTTVVAGLLNEKILSLAHVGDSRAYLYRDGELTRLTDDHSWVHEQVSAGILTEEEAKTHPLKNVVTRALGGGPSVVARPARDGVPAGRRLSLLLRRADDDALRRGDPRLGRRRRGEGRRGALPGPRRSRQREGRRRQHHRRRSSGSRTARAPAKAEPRTEGRQADCRQAASRATPRRRTSVQRLTCSRCGRLPSRNASNVRLSGLTLAGHPPGDAHSVLRASSAPARARTGRSSTAPVWTRPSALRPRSARSLGRRGGRLDARGRGSCSTSAPIPRELGRLWVQEVVLGAAATRSPAPGREEAAGGGETPSSRPGAAASRRPRATTAGAPAAARPRASTRRSSRGVARRGCSLVDLESGALDAAPPDRAHRPPPVVPARNGRRDAPRSPGRADGGDGAAVVRYADAALPPDVVFFAAGDRARDPALGRGAHRLRSSRGAPRAAAASRRRSTACATSALAVRAARGARRGGRRRPAPDWSTACARRALGLGGLPRGGPAGRPDRADRARDRAVLRERPRSRSATRSSTLGGRAGTVLPLHGLGGHERGPAGAGLRGDARHRRE